MITISIDTTKRDTKEFQKMAKFNLLGFATGACIAMDEGAEKVEDIVAGGLVGAVGTYLFSKIFPKTTHEILKAI